jgi:hypothetical protein
MRTEKRHNSDTKATYNLSEITASAQILKSTGRSQFCISETMWGNKVEFTAQSVTVNFSVSHSTMDMD